uniref:Uncharacterized protein n=1 Tax=Anguilla anguilla TaxID=7936 RepID=A0A0E9T1P4_ANGAN
MCCGTPQTRAGPRLPGAVLCCLDTGSMCVCTSDATDGDHHSA